MSDERTRAAWEDDPQVPTQPFQKPSRKEDDLDGTADTHRTPAPSAE